MKTLITITLLMAMASVTNASLQISLNGDTDPVDSEYNFYHGDHIMLGIWTSTPIPLMEGNYFALVVNTHAAYIDYTSGVTLVADSGYFIDNTMDAVSAGFPLPPGYNGSWGQAITYDLINGVPAGTTLFDLIDIQRISWNNGDALVQLYETLDGIEMTLADSVIIHIPEPITVALLGLGGLFLRRRK